MRSVKLLEFPNLPGCQDVAAELRELADEIDKGTKGDAHNLAWALDCGNGVIQVGLMGKAPQPALTAYYLLGVAQRKLEQI